MDFKLVWQNQNVEKGIKALFAINVNLISINILMDHVKSALMFFIIMIILSLILLNLY